LIDSLLGYYLYPYRKQVSRSIIRDTPKFYLFDVGLANHLKRVNITEYKGIDAGHALEHTIFLELLAYLSYHERDEPLCYWRTKSGQEVDFIIGDGEIAIEVKISDLIQKKDLSGLSAFGSEHHPKKRYVVSMEPRPRIMTDNIGDIHIYPAIYFLQKLWAGDVI
jgi:predicted AAA+ superfamily ATPase